MISCEDVERVITLRSEGYSYQKIASQLGISKPTVIKHAINNRNLIENFHQLRKDALANELKNNFELRMRSFDELFSKLSTEIQTRDLTDENTSTLIKLMLEMDRRLSKIEKVDFETKSDSPYLDLIDYAL